MQASVPEKTQADTSVGKYLLPSMFDLGIFCGRVSRTPKETVGKLTQISVVIERDAFGGFG